MPGSMETLNDWLARAEQLHPKNIELGLERAKEMAARMGLRFDWTLLQGHAHSLPWALSGGLTPDNVVEAIRVTGATAVDVSSGVESVPGVKDVDKIAAFLQSVARC